MRYIFCFAFLFLALCSTHAHEYMFHSVDGHFYIVKAEYDETAQEVRYTNAKQTLTYSHVESLKDTSLVGYHFLKMVYNTTNTDGRKQQHTVLLTVSDNVLYEAAHILSTDDNTPGYAVAAKVSYNTANAYELALKADNGSVSYAYFEPALNLFVGSYKKIKGVPKDVPMIDLGAYKYSYIDGHWCIWDARKGTYNQL